MTLLKLFFRRRIIDTMSPEEEIDVASSGRDERPAKKTGKWSGWFASSAGSTAAAISVAAITLALWLWRSSAQVPDGGFWAAWGIQGLDFALALVIGLVLATVLNVVARVVGRRPSWWLLWSVIAAGFLVATMGGGASLVGWLVLAGLLLLAAGTVAAAVVWELSDRRNKNGTDRSPRLKAGGAAAVLVLVVLIGFVIWPGGSASQVALPMPTSGGASLLDSAAGPPAEDTAIIETRYGAARPGPDAEYGPGVPITTAPVDASRLIGGWDADSTRSDVWGFDSSSLPINGLVWMPTGPGPFPLAVLVHGNSAFDHSERGLAYLGRSLALRGYVVASIDENFLSTGIFDKSAPITGANVARAWLVLQHVRQFVEWNSMADSPFEGKLDTSRISLIGHSRGGEAVAVAAAFNSLPSLPEDPSVTFDFGFALRTVIAIAPSDGQYLPGGKPVTLTGVNYLTFAGTMDADVGTFAGARQFARVKTDDTHLAAAIAIERANHTQFNSDWGRFDVGLGAAAHLLATGPLLSPAEQQRATTGLVGAFLDLTVQDRTQYRGLFDGTCAIPGWLPDTVYLRRFVAGGGAGLSRFDQGGNIDSPLGPATVNGGTGQVVGLPTKTGPSSDQVLQLTGSEAEISYTISDLKAEQIPAGADITVDAGTDADAADIEIAVRATDASGKSATLPLLPWVGIPGQLDGRTLKPLVPGGSGKEVYLQTFSIAVSALAEQGLDSATITDLSVVLGGAAGRLVYLDSVGVR